MLDQGVIDAMNQGEGNAYVTLTNSASSQLVDGMYRTTNGSACGQWSNSGSDAQKWQLVPAGRYVHLVNKATGLYLDGLYSTTNGSAAGQWSYSGSDAQFWLIQPMGNYFTLANKATGMYLDGLYNYTNGANAGQWTGSGSTAQQWTIGTVGHVQATAATPAAISRTANQLAIPTVSGIQAYPNPFSSAFHLTVATRHPSITSRYSTSPATRSGSSAIPPCPHPYCSAARWAPANISSKFSAKNGAQSFKLIKINK